MRLCGDIESQCQRPGHLISQWGGTFCKVAMNAYCHKSVPVMTGSYIGLLVEFYILAKSKVILGQVMICNSALMANL